ncbi:MAG: hypothetical protein LJE83_14780 [Gammaproteobacteria bacterium]|jgi:hypothetical protein|nr:hypothetical protein [Gammaproteobacteria bacterium]
MFCFEAAAPQTKRVKHNSTDEQTGIEVGKMAHAGMGCGAFQDQAVHQVKHHCRLPKYQQHTI